MGKAEALPEGHTLPKLAPGQDPHGVGSIGPDGLYRPAPPAIGPGEPPLADNWGSSGGGDVPDVPPSPKFD